jgi:hypothetical protein
MQHFNVRCGCYIVDVSVTSKKPGVVHQQLGKVGEGVAMQFGEREGKQRGRRGGMLRGKGRFAKLAQDLGRILCECYSNITKLGMLRKCYSNTNDRGNSVDITPMSQNSGKAKRTLERIS